MGIGHKKTIGDLSFMACCCSRYNACSDWLIAGHFSLVMHGLAKTKQKAV